MFRLYGFIGFFTTLVVSTSGFAGSISTEIVDENGITYTIVAKSQRSSFGVRYDNILMKKGTSDSVDSFYEIALPRTLSGIPDLFCSSSTSRSIGSNDFLKVDPDKIFFYVDTTWSYPNYGPNIYGASYKIVKYRASDLKVSRLLIDVGC